MSSKYIRLATLDDTNAILDIYAYYIRNTTISFETEVPSLSEFESRIEGIISIYPWLVYEENGKILGYAYACRHRQRAAYQWAVDVAIYLDKDTTGKGIGKKLYQVLLSILKLQGFYVAYGGVTQPNEPSNALHINNGFKKIAEYKNVGYKMGKWHTVIWYSKPLNSSENAPSPFKTIDELDPTLLQQILNQAI